MGTCFLYGQGSYKKNQEPVQELISTNSGTNLNVNVSLSKDYDYVIIFGDAHFQSSPICEISCNGGTLDYNKAYSVASYNSSTVKSISKVYKNVPNGSKITGYVQYNGSYTILGITMPNE